MISLIQSSYYALFHHVLEDSNRDFYNMQHISILQGLPESPKDVASLNSKTKVDFGRKSSSYTFIYYAIEMNVLRPFAVGGV